VDEDAGGTQSRADEDLLEVIRRNNLELTPEEVQEMLDAF
jgi:hypothetical protein